MSHYGPTKSYMAGLPTTHGSNFTHEAADVTYEDIYGLFVAGAATMAVLFGILLTFGYLAGLTLLVCEGSERLYRDSFPWLPPAFRTEICLVPFLPLMIGVIGPVGHVLRALFRDANTFVGFPLPWSSNRPPDRASLPLLDNMSAAQAKDIEAGLAHLD